MVTLFKLFDLLICHQPNSCRWRREAFKSAADLRSAVRDRRTILVPLVKSFGHYDLGKQKRLGQSIRKDVEKQGREVNDAGYRKESVACDMAGVLPELLANAFKTLKSLRLTN